MRTQHPVPSDASAFSLIVRQADLLAQSRIIPRAYQGKSFDIIAAGLAGQSFGWDVMTSMRNYHVIEGTATLRPEAMLGLVRRAGHSVSIETVSRGDERVAIAKGRRADNGDEHTAEFSTEDAMKAGLLNKNNWKNYRDAMLTWRAVSALCRVLYPDVVLGAGYVPEELGAEVSATGDIVEDDPFATRMVSPGEAKRALLAACDGDKAKAILLWGDRGSEAITESDLEALLAEAITEEAEVVAVSDETPALEQSSNDTVETSRPARAKLGSAMTLVEEEVV